MGFSSRLDLAKRLDELIRRKATGSPRELAGRLLVSEATVYRYIQDLKNLGAPIKDGKYRKTYLYEGEFQLLE